MSDNAVTQLKVACDNAYDQYPGSCSHAVWSVIRAIVNPKEEHRQANAMIVYFGKNWKTVDLEEGYKLANEGKVVVGGLEGTTNGHVIVIYPGDKIESGGYEFLYKKENKMLKMRSHGKFPRALSTSIGSWPGAMSKGDKTVWDPWGNDEVFKKVAFWTPK